MVIEVKICARRPVAASSICGRRRSHRVQAAHASRHCLPSGSPAQTNPPPCRRSGRSLTPTRADRVCRARNLACRPLPIGKLWRDLNGTVSFRFIASPGGPTRKVATESGRHRRGSAPDRAGIAARDRLRRSQARTPAARPDLRARRARTGDNLSSAGRAGC